MPSFEDEILPLKPCQNTKLLLPLAGRYLPDALEAFLKNQAGILRHNCGCGCERRFKEPSFRPFEI